MPRVEPGAHRSTTGNPVREATPETSTTVHTRTGKLPSGGCVFVEYAADLQNHRTATIDADRPGVATQAAP